MTYFVGNAVLGRCSVTQHHLFTSCTIAWHTERYRTRSSFFMRYSRLDHSHLVQVKSLEVRQLRAPELDEAILPGCDQPTRGMVD